MPEPGTVSRKRKVDLTDDDQPILGKRAKSEVGDSSQFNGNNMNPTMNTATNPMNPTMGAMADRKKENPMGMTGKREKNQQLMAKDQTELDTAQEDGHSVIPIEKLQEWADRYQQSGPASQKAVKFNTADIRHLREAGYSTIDSLAFSSLRKLILVRGISENKAEVLHKMSQKLVPANLVISNFQSASEQLKVRKSLPRISTGSSKLDGLLQGGIETGSVTELFGEFRSGKTQLVHTLSVIAQFPADQGGCEGKVCFIDTEGCFRPERLAEIAERFDVEPADVLDNVVFCRAFNCEHQMQLLTEAAVLMAQAKFGLLVVDSITHLYRTEYSGRGELADRQQHLGKFLRTLQRLADVFQIAVVVTNQVQARVDGAAMYGPTTCPIGGHILAHACQTRLSLRKGKGDGRICKIYDSPTLPESDAPFALSSGGVIDDTS